MANNIPFNDIPSDRNTFDLIDYEECKEVIHQLVHNAHHTVTSIEALTDSLWPLIRTDKDCRAINRSLREHWAHEANERNR